MSCGTGECGCGCDDFVQLGAKKSLPVIQEKMDCGDGSCGCGCGDVVTLESSQLKAEMKGKQKSPENE